MHVAISRQFSVHEFFLRQIDNRNPTGADQGRDRVADDRQLDELVKRLWENGRFEWEGRNLLPTDQPRQGIVG
ncbi:hypothetical protein AB1L30_00090, partial [Bremerella sp. JC817]|uniref:hypothetical protein n=1 Tax=Bremerella sp. JC817 TaxID=3231756 RepID=UPI003457F30C